MSNTNSVVAVFRSHDVAEEAIRDLQIDGFDMKKISVVGKDYHTEELLVGYYTTTFFRKEIQVSAKSPGHDHHCHASSPAVKGGSAKRPDPASQNAGEHERSHLIQIRAYGLWEQAGKPDGEASRQRFWCEAEKELNILACAE